MSNIQPIPAASSEYDQNDQDAFRRAVRESIATLSTESELMALLFDPRISLATRRITFSPPVSVVAFTL